MQLAAYNNSRKMGAFIFLLDMNGIFAPFLAFLKPSNCYSSLFNSLGFVFLCYCFLLSNFVARRLTKVIEFKASLVYIASSGPVRAT